MKRPYRWFQGCQARQGQIGKIVAMQIMQIQNRGLLKKWIAWEKIGQEISDIIQADMLTDSFYEIFHLLSFCMAKLVISRIRQVQIAVIKAMAIGQHRSDACPYEAVMQAICRDKCAPDATIRIEMKDSDRVRQLSFPFIFKIIHRSLTL